MLSIKEFNSLFTEYYEPFLRFATSYVRNESIAEEITAEAFTLFWEKSENLPEQTNYPAYILTIIKNLSLNHLKRSTLKRNIANTIQQVFEWELSTRINSLEACDPNYLFSQEVESILNNAINRLPSKTQEIFILSKMEGMSHKEIAKKMNMTTKGVEYHIYKSIKQLKEDLKDYLPSASIFFINILFFN